MIVHGDQDMVELWMDRSVQSSLSSFFCLASKNFIKLIVQVFTVNQADKLTEEL